MSKTLLKFCVNKERGRDRYSLLRPRLRLNSQPQWATPVSPERFSQCSTLLDREARFRFRFLQIGSNFCTGNFVNLEAELGAKFWEANFGRRISDPSSWVKFFDPVFASKRSPQEKFTLNNLTTQNSTQKWGKKSHCTYAGPCGKRFRFLVGVWLLCHPALRLKTSLKIF